MKCTVDDSWTAELSLMKFCTHMYLDNLYSCQQWTRFRTDLDKNLIVNISGTDQAIGKRKMALSTTIFPWERLGELWSTRITNCFALSGMVKNPKLRACDLDLWHMTLKFSNVHADVTIHVHAKCDGAQCSGSWCVESNTIQIQRQTVFY